jgi:uncharacterized membrane protein YhaH (DUF805 family)
VTNQLFCLQCWQEQTRAVAVKSHRATDGVLMANLLFGFRGRITRAKFWLVALGIFVVGLVLFAALGGNVALLVDPPEIPPSIGPFASTVLLAFGVLATWISLAVAVKRYHDRDKSGWWVLIIFVPVIGGLWYLIECGFLRGSEGHNNYGRDPLERY